MNIDFIVSQNYGLQLEYIIAEFEISKANYIEKNPKVNTTKMDDKLKMLNNIRNFHWELFELCEKVKKENARLDFENKKLHAEINILKNK